MKLYLFDDRKARTWAPFHLTRPVGELLYGCLLLRERAERLWDTECVGHLTGSGLVGFTEENAPPVVSLAEVPDDQDRLFLSSRFVPEWSDEGPPVPARSSDEASGGRPGGGDDGGRADAVVTALVNDGRIVGWWIPAGRENPGEDAVLEPAEDPSAVSGAESGRTVEIAGRLLEQPWHLMAGNADRIRDDLSELYPHSGAFLPPHATQIGGDHPISVGHDVELEPGVVFDVRDGPVILEDRVRIGAHARLEGPLWVGPGSTIYGGSVSGSTIGPRCKVRGEIDASVILGFSNKAHDGFLGHAYLGRWVNLGALTTNSDLKNNYGNVRIRRGGPEGMEELDTGLMKVGCFLGDHVKTGIGTLLTTGAVVGAGSNLFGSEIPPAWIPPFSWGGAEGLQEHRIDAFLETAERAMARRDQELSEDMAALFRRAHESSRDLR